MKTTDKIINQNNKNLLSKLIPQRGSLPEKETKSTIINWYFKIYLN